MWSDQEIGLPTCPQSINGRPNIFGETSQEGRTKGGGLLIDWTTYGNTKLVGLDV